MRTNHAPLFEPAPGETLAQRCVRFADEIEDYERDITNGSILHLTDIEETLRAAAEALAHEA